MGCGFRTVQRYSQKLINPEPHWNPGNPGAFKPSKKGHEPATSANIKEAGLSKADETKLNKTFCENVEVNKRTEFPDHKETGLRLRVTPAGSKSWSYLYYRPGDGSRARLNFGTYPAISIDEARRKAREARSKLDRGDDPGAARNAREVVETFDRLADLYLERHAYRHKRTAAVNERILNKDIRPVIGRLPIERVTRSDIHALLDRVSERGAPVQTQRVFEIVRGVFRWGISEDFIANDPTYALKRHHKPTERDRTLSDPEITRVLTQIDATPIDRRCKLALKLALATGQRMGEVCGAGIQEFDLLRATWTIPGARAKNAQVHDVPLGTYAIALVTEAMKATAGSTFLFASKPRDRAKHGDAEQALLPSSATKAFARIRDDLRIGPDPATPHDFRRTFATFMQREGVAEPVVARLLNHRSDKAKTVTSKVYMRHEFADEKREAMALWDNYLKSLTMNDTDDQANTVVPLR